MDEGRERYEDFDEVALAPTNPINAVMADIIQGSEAPADIAYYLGSHLQEATAISRMTAIQAAREIGKIEEKLVAALKVNPKSNVSKAPPPIKPVTGPGEVVTKDPNKMSMEEYRRAREEGKI